MKKSHRILIIYRIIAFSGAHTLYNQSEKEKKKKQFSVKTPHVSCLCQHLTIKSKWEGEENVLRYTYTHTHS